MSTTEDQAQRDGFTLIEILVVVSVLGILVSTIALAFSVIVRTLPSTEVRVDDARSTRGLATWLSHDTTSAPPYLPEQAGKGGINTTTGSTADNNDCSGQGQNVLHLQWVEKGFTTTTFVANYRFVVSGGEGRIVRYTCSGSGSGPYPLDSTINLTSGLDPAAPPWTDPQWDGTEVVAIDVVLTATSGQQVVVETGSRNPMEFYS